MSSREQLCGVMVKKSRMPELRPCLREKGHRACGGGGHTPDLTGLENVFGYKKILSRATDYPIPGSKYTRIRWLVLDNLGDTRPICASTLFTGRSAGKQAANYSVRGSQNEKGVTSPEYNTIRHHYQYIFNKKHSKHNSYKNMVFFDGWNPNEDGSTIAGAQWLRKNMPKPGPDYQLHVLKTKQHPYGFFGPGGVVWRSKMDRHDNDVLDLVAEWSNKKWKSFVESENSRRGFKEKK
jgi:hypothetical protein